MSRLLIALGRALNSVQLPLWLGLAALLVGLRLSRCGAHARTAQLEPLGAAAGGATSVDARVLCAASACRNWRAARDAGALGRAGAEGAGMCRELLSPPDRAPARPRARRGHGRRAAGASPARLRADRHARLARAARGRSRPASSTPRSTASRDVHDSTARARPRARGPPDRAGADAGHRRWWWAASSC